MPADILSALLASLDDARTLNPAAMSARLHGEIRRALDTAERACADALPPLDTSDPDKLADDPEIRSEIQEWRDRRGYTSIDVSDFPDECGDKWEILRGSSRYEVRGLPRYEVRRVGGPGQLEARIVWDNATGEAADVDPDVEKQAGIDPVSVGYTERAAGLVLACLVERTEAHDESGVWIVWDTDYDEPVNPDGDDDVPSYDPEDEDDARTSADQGNREDYRNNACGWPFAHNYAVEISERDADDFHAAGFVVAQYDGGTVYAGIDGGGYDFTGHHWSPLFFASFARYGGYVRTRDGLRRVAAGGGAR